MFHHCYFRLGARVEHYIEVAFAKWGFLCARYPKSVIACCVIICAVCIGGLAKFTVITNPVDLWSSPNSRARQEKDYFDDNFT